MPRQVLLFCESLRLDHGGPSRSVADLGEAIANHGNDVILVSCSTIEGESVEVSPRLKHVEVDGRARETPLAYYRGVRGQFRRLFDHLKPDIVHVNGMWDLSSWALQDVALSERIPLVISPRGALSPQAMESKRLRKLLALRILRRGAIRAAAFLHVTSSLEATHVRAQFPDSLIEVLPNGVYLPSKCVDHYGLGKPFMLTVLARLAPIKGIDNLIQAWSRVLHDDWQLQIAGPGSTSYISYLVQLAARLGVSSSVTFLPATYGVAKNELLLGSSAIALPSHSENFGVSIAEGMACGLPILTTSGTPWSDAVALGCGWQCSPTISGLSDALTRLFASTRDSRSEMGRQSRFYAATNLDWKEIGARMGASYEIAVRDRRKRFEIASHTKEH